MKSGLISATLFSLMLAACAAPTPREPLKSHLSSETTTPPLVSGEIPTPVQQTLALPKPRTAPKAETYSVVVNNVQVRDLLFALARDAKVNVDIHPGITGIVTLNAIDQTLPQLLTRISKQVDMRFEMDGPNLSVMPDSPFLKHYKVDYVNMSRNVTGTVSANTQIATGLPGGTTGSSSSGNTSKTEITNSSKNIFWESLEKNIKDILHETDKTFPEGSSETVTEQSNSQSATGAAALPQGSGARAAQAVANALQGNPNPGSSSQAVGNSVVRRSTFREAASVIVNPESGTVTVRATQRQHDRIQEFVDRVVNAARRQVLIEATIIEVVLKDGYEQGIDWTQMSSGGVVKILSRQLNGTANLSYDKTDNPSALINLLETFGTTKVLSSPRLSVLNNQTALLKVVENVVFFNVKSDIAGATTNSGALKSFTTTPQTVSVGLVLTVTPQISDNNQIVLNIRPSITSIASFVTDPNPDLKIPNQIPQIRTREIESIMRVSSGEIAILGGLMEDKIDYQNQRIPVIGQIPIAGELVNNRNNLARKAELVIFLRPVVIKDASLNGDYRNLRSLLPNDGFFDQPREAQPFNNFPNR